VAPHGNESNFFCSRGRERPNFLLVYGPRDYHKISPAAAEAIHARDFLLIHNFVGARRHIAGPLQPYYINVVPVIFLISLPLYYPPSSLYLFSLLFTTHCSLALGALGALGATSQLFKNLRTELLPIILFMCVS
jgi:hypothetical protein